MRFFVETITLVLPVLGLVAGAPARAYNEPRAAAPSVHIMNGTVIGSTSQGVDSFKGIPFAQPPTGQLRLKPPQTITKTFGSIQATGTPASCPAFAAQSNNTSLPAEVVGLLTDSPLFQSLLGAQEDCLTLNVQRPSNTVPGKLLPVVFYIYGGGFELGSTSMYDGSAVVSQSSSLGEPVLYVTSNYRVGGFGFLGGKELQQEGSSNLGLRDQRLALQWVAENIKAFGGDPERVTIWGESAGSISVYDQLLINRGDNTYRGKPLFIGAVMDSGSAIPTFDVANEIPQGIFDTVASSGGCSGAANVLQCLRALPYQQFLEATTSVPGIFSYRSLDLSYLPRYDPHDDFFSISPSEAGLSGSGISKVPIIIGDQEDEGTLFSLAIANVSNTQDLVQYLMTYFPAASQQQIQGLVDTYPEDPAAGSPFGSGVLNELYPGFKRNAAILGDLTFTLTRRIVLSATNQANPGLKLWSYLASYFKGTPILGTFHGSDLLLLFDNFPLEIPRQSILHYYISFFNHQDPNALGTTLPLIEWPNWTNDNPTLMNFQALGNQLIPDTFREESSNYTRSIQNVLIV